MGLQITPQFDDSSMEVAWSYHGFAQFREEIARDGLGIPHLRAFYAAAQEDPELWERFGNDPLVYLINHSDCDGDLTEWECEGLGPRLRTTVANRADDDHIKERALALAEAAEAVVERGGRLEFH